MLIKAKALDSLEPIWHRLRCQEVRDDAGRKVGRQSCRGCKVTFDLASNTGLSTSAWRIAWAACGAANPLSTRRATAVSETGSPSAGERWCPRLIQRRRSTRRASTSGAAGHHLSPAE